MTSSRCRSFWYTTSSGFCWKGFLANRKHLTIIICKDPKVYYRARKRHVSDFDEICTRCVFWGKNSKKVSILSISGCHGNQLFDFGHFGAILTWKMHKYSLTVPGNTFYWIAEIIRTMSAYFDLPLASKHYMHFYYDVLLFLDIVAKIGQAIVNLAKSE